MLAWILFAHLAAASPPLCERGAVIDLNHHPVVALGDSSEEARVSLENSASRLETDYAPSGFDFTAHTFTAQAFLDSKALTRKALENGGYLHVAHGIGLESCDSWVATCTVTYDPAPVEVVLAEQALAKAKKAAAMASVMICDPERTREHRIKAPAPAGPIKVPAGQATQGDNVWTIWINPPFTRQSWSQVVAIKDDRLVSATSDNDGLFCKPTGLDDLCVNTEAVFALTDGKPFSISTTVKDYFKTLRYCEVTR